MGVLDTFSPYSLLDVAHVQNLLSNGLIEPKTVMDWMNGPVAAVTVETKLPEHCSECNHHNPYVGKEHITACGKYVCRQCKPAFQQKQRLEVLKLEALAREARKTDYSGGANPPYRGPVEEWQRGPKQLQNGDWVFKL